MCLKKIVVDNMWKCGLLKTSDWNSVDLFKNTLCLVVQWSHQSKETLIWTVPAPRPHLTHGGLDTFKMAEGLTIYYSTRFLSKSKFDAGYKPVLWPQNRWDMSPDVSDEQQTPVWPSFNAVIGWRECARSRPAPEAISNRAPKTGFLFTKPTNSEAWFFKHTIDH